MALTIKDILILDYFDGKPIHAKIPDYRLTPYGADANMRVEQLMTQGWIRHSKPRETVNLLPDKSLSDFLLRHGLSGTGGHADLVRRIIDEIPEREYAFAVPKLYVVSTEGKGEIGRHMAYVLNVRENYGLSEGEIGEARTALMQRGEGYTARDVLLRAFEKKESLLIMAGEWSKLRNLYYTVANFYIRTKQDGWALQYLYLVFFVDMSGMGNKNSLVPYENLFPTQKGMILLMDDLRKREGLSAEEVRTSFLTNLARRAPRLPFSYFSPQLMASLLLERMEGIDFNGAKYIARRNVPDPTAKSYHYIPYGRSEKRTGLQKPFPIQPKMVAPPVLRMPDFVAPPPFRPTEVLRRDAIKSGGANPLPKDIKKETSRWSEFLKKWF